MQSRSLNTVLDMLLCYVKMVCSFCKFISLTPVDRLERRKKGSSKNGHAIWKTYY